MILLVLMLAVGVRLARELMMGGVNWLTAMGDMPVEAAETPVPTPVPPYVSIMPPLNEKGFIDKGNGKNIPDKIE